jgi:acyl carrier protein
MTSEDVMTKLKDVLKRDFAVPPEKVTREASFRETLSLESLDIVDLVDVLEKAYGVRAEPSEYMKLGTVGAVCDFIVEMHGRLAKG